MYTVVLAGDTVTEMDPGAVTVTLAVPDLLVSCALVALTWKEPAVPPAVKRPE